MKIMRSLNACIFVGLLVFVLTQLSSSSAERERRQLPCNHALRISFPQFFTHCDSVRACTYSSWSSWKRVADSEASTPKCPSGLAYREERTRIKITGTSCTEPLLEIQHICKLEARDFDYCMILFLHHPHRCANSGGTANHGSWSRWIWQ